MNMLAGFHGDSIAGEWYYNNFTGYVSGVQYNGIGDDWVDELVNYNSGNNGGHCPAALVFAENTSDADHIYQYGGFEDYQSGYWGTGIRSYYAYEGCNPMRVQLREIRCDICRLRARKSLSCSLGSTCPGITCRSCPRDSVVHGRLRLSHRRVVWSSAGGFSA